MAFAYKDISGTSTSEVQQEILSDEILSSDMFLTISLAWIDLEQLLFIQKA